MDADLVVTASCRPLSVSHWLLCRVWHLPRSCGELRGGEGQLESWYHLLALPSSRLPLHCSVLVAVARGQSPRMASCDPRKQRRTALCLPCDVGSSPVHSLLVHSFGDLCMHLLALLMCWECSCVTRDGACAVAVQDVLMCTQLPASSCSLWAPASIPTHSDVSCLSLPPLGLLVLVLMGPSLPVVILPLLCVQCLPV